MQIKYLTDEFEQVADLILECFPDINTKENIINSLQNSSNLSLLAVAGEEVLGHVMIDIRYDIIKEKTIFFLNYICVTKNERNKGIASLLLKKVEEIAKEKNVNSIEFTSNTKRLAAHNLYLKNNFRIKDTSYFQKML